MQFEDFDKKIREAADHHHPSYNETAWDKMEKLLDKHLPEKKDDRRRFIFFILFPLLLAGGIWLLVSQPWDEKEKVDTNKSDSSQEVRGTSAEPKPGANNSPAQITGNDPLSNQTVSNEDRSDNGTPGVAPPVAERTEDFEAIVSNPTTKKKTNKRNETNANDVIINDKVTNEKQVTIPPAAPVVTNNDKAEDKVPPTKKTGEKGVVVAEQKEADKVKEEVKVESKVTETVAESKNKKAGKKSNSFFLSLSAGPDVSAAGSGLGEVKMLYGAGIGYTIKDRFTIRTGFYTARKIYSAGKEDYKPNPTPPNYYYLDEVYANCKVYEIPLNFAYNFGRTSKSNFFASAGLSSYIMKEEVYDYVYKYPGNPPVTYTHTYTYKNENNHVFSVLGISGGYQRKLSKSVSVSAEPYLRIPLSGVGNGNVKLNSGGVLFSLNVKPFNR